MYVCVHTCLRYLTRSHPPPPPLRGNSAQSVVLVHGTFGNYVLESLTVTRLRSGVYGWEAQLVAFRVPIVKFRH